MTVIYMDVDMRLSAPRNKNQVVDRETWCPGAVVGERIDAADPILYEADRRGAALNEDRRRQGHRLQPGSQLRHAEDHDGGRRLRSRRRDAERPRARGRELPRRARRPAADRTRRAPHRGHLALPLQGRVLAARSGDDDGDRRGRHGALGHQGQGAGRAGVRAARRALARRRDGLRPRQRRRHRGTVRPSASTSSSATRPSARSAAIPGLQHAYGVGHGEAALRARREGQRRPRTCGAPRTYLCFRAAAVRAPPRRSSAPTSTCCTTCTTG